MFLLIHGLISFCIELRSQSCNGVIYSETFLCEKRDSSIIGAAISSQRKFVPFAAGGANVCASSPLFYVLVSALLQQVKWYAAYCSALAWQPCNSNEGWPSLGSTR